MDSILTYFGKEELESVVFCKKLEKLEISPDQWVKCAAAADTLWSAVRSDPELLPIFLGCHIACGRPVIMVDGSMFHGSSVGNLDFSPCCLEYRTESLCQVLIKESQQKDMDTDSFWSIPQLGNCVYGTVLAWRPSTLCHAISTFQNDQNDMHQKMEGIIFGRISLSFAR